MSMNDGMTLDPRPHDPGPVNLAAWTPQKYMFVRPWPCAMRAPGLCSGALARVGADALRIESPTRVLGKGAGR